MSLLALARALRIRDYFREIRLAAKFLYEKAISTFLFEFQIDLSNIDVNAIKADVRPVSGFV